MKIVLLDAITFGDTNLSGLDRFGEVKVYDKTTTDQTLARIQDTDVVVTNKVVITKEMMQKCKNLKLICIAATGMNNVDLESAKELGIAVKNVSGYSTDSVIQHTFSMLFYLMGSSRYYDESVRDGTYSHSGVFTDVSRPFFELKGKKWGIIGLGEIGRGVAKVVSCFGSNVCYYSTSGKNNNAEYESVTLELLLSSCDIITIHAPLNNQTNNLLDYKQLSLCKEGAIVLNLGRGGIINENAVTKLVDEKNIYFGLDVFAKEPLPSESPLLGVKNKERLYMTPHIAWTSVEARDELIAGVIKNIAESF
ncbi:D-2-hydroxyacid dehydrogenase [Sulfurimonas sp.]|uniref:D-2-hydroxyacid dehydrogenase n=1 Tax=Sulfurimonas sp. TaxID=2022749 RepID=UPI003D0D1D3A